MLSMSEPHEDSCPDLSRLRREYSTRSLVEKDVYPDPIKQFIAWLNEAIAAGANEPNAMTLATATRSGAPSARMVLLKAVDSQSFSFFTNYNSRKARELEQNPHAALVFYWPEVERQVRIEGTITRTSESESEIYFASRPVDARLSAAASPQGEPVASRAILEARINELRKQFPDGNVPRPPHWGGYRLTPTRFEFWQGRPNRLHDRIEYHLANNTWAVQRLAP
jgi:pyridoxamine 5'-phosphate oxidase